MICIRLRLSSFFSLLLINNRIIASVKENDNSSGTLRGKLRNRKEGSEGYSTDEREEDDEEEEGRTAPEESVDGSIEDGDGGNDGSEDDLRREDSIDLADEAPTELVLANAETWVKGLLP